MKTTEDFKQMIYKYIEQSDDHQLITEKHIENFAKKMENYYNSNYSVYNYETYIAVHFTKDRDVLYEFTGDWDEAETLDNLAYELNWKKQAILDFYIELDFIQVDTVEEFVIQKITQENILGYVPTQLLIYLDYQKIYDDYFDDKYHIVSDGFVKKSDEIYQGVLNDKSI